MAAAAALRIWLSVGHGLGNARPGIFDTGATSCVGSEHEIVYRVLDLVADQFYRDENASVTVIEAPSCSTSCVERHPRSAHLGYKIQYINDNLKRDARGRVLGEVLIDLHMNSADDEAANGTEVLYSAGAPASRRGIAEKISAAVSATLGTKNRGAKSDRESHRGKLAILNRTDLPAYLIELAFVTNPEDVRKVRECGKEAVLAAIEVIAKEHAQ